MKHLVAGVCVLLIGIVSLIGFHGPAAAQGQSVAEVWALEDDYWRYVKAGDEASRQHLADHRRHVRRP